MAELTNLERKVAEVLGLAQAAQGVTEKVEGLVDDDDIKSKLQRQREEAEETERRGTEIADSRDGKKTAIMDKARETKGEATEMMKTYLEGEEEALDGFEFLTMAEAGELGHWEIVKTMATKAKDRGLVRLADWATPIQRNHVEAVRTSSLKLAESEDPNEPAK